MRRSAAKWARCRLCVRASVTWPFWFARVLYAATLSKGHGLPTAQSSSWAGTTGIGITINTELGDKLPALLDAAVPPAANAGSLSSPVTETLQSSCENCGNSAVSLISQRHHRIYIRG